MKALPYLLPLVLALALGAFAYREYAHYRSRIQIQNLQTQRDSLLRGRQELENRISDAQQQLEKQITENRGILATLENRARLSSREVDSLRQRVQEADSSRQAFLTAWKQTLAPETAP